MYFFRFFIAACLFLNFDSFIFAKKLDGIIAVFDSDIITLSEAKRILTTFDARAEIAPMIFKPKEKSLKRSVNTVIEKLMVRKKLNEVGYVIGEDVVDERITKIQEVQGITRSFLKDLLKSKGIQFEEYYELMKQTIEFSYFTSKIISPLVSVTDQDIKNYYYTKINNSQNSSNFNFSLIDFRIPSSVKTREEVLSELKNFRITGSFSEKFQGIKASRISSIDSSSLSPLISQSLNKTLEGDYSQIVKIGNQRHIFFVQSKNLTEASGLRENKNQIRNFLYAQKMEEVVKQWFSTEYEKHFIKQFI